MGGTKIKRNYVVAHALEARAIISFYRLSKNQSHSGFDLFENDSTRVIVGGQGKSNCAAAVSYIAGLNYPADTSDLWVNLGVAGHGDCPIGNLFRINKIVDLATGKSLFPVELVRNSKITGAPVMTVEKPETHYQNDCLYDMEASAFFNTATRFVSAEYVNSFKVVSDNKSRSLEYFKPKQAVILIESCIERIDDYLNELENKLNNYIRYNSQLIELKDKIFDRYHFTHSQRQQVSSLLDALSVHDSQFESWPTELEKPSELIALLNKRLEQIELTM